MGYGPRFLHSTGQLHKGDAGRGLFIQFTADDPRDAPIPDELGRPESALTFGILKQAQVFGDRQALLNAGRRAIRIHLRAGIRRTAYRRLTATPVTPRRENAMIPGTLNRLQHEKSPYLLQHAANPVDWYPWGEEAFARAKTGGQARLPVDRLFHLPLVPCHGPRIL